MSLRIILTILISLFSSIAMADSISVTLKPAKGLSGTTSLNIHDGGNVTILVYESATKISEDTVNIEQNKIDELRLLTLDALKSYIDQTNYDHVKEYSFTISLAHTDQGVTKSVSSKQINKEAIKVIKQIIMLIPGINLKREFNL